MYKNLIISSLIIISSLLFIGSFNGPVEQRPDPSPSITAYSVRQALKVGDSIVYESTHAALPSETAFDLLARTQQVEIKQYSFGKLVTAINGISNGTDNKYWTYFVNNQEASSSADSYKLKPNDVILWKFTDQP